MVEVSIIGIDLSKNSYQLHGAHADGSVAFRRKLSRSKVLAFLASQPRCTVAMEACGSAHYWGREIGRLGHEVRLIPPTYVKAYVKRQKNDAAEAICEAAQRPTMHFVAVKSEEQQAGMMQFGVRDLPVRQRTQTINALRGHLAEFGIVAPKGPVHVRRLALALEGPEGARLPATVRELGGLLLEQIAEFDRKIAEQNKELHAAARQDEEAVRAMTVPGVGPITALALQALAPPLASFRRGRDFSAWLGLVPRQHTTAGKPRLGKVSKMGQRDLRRLLVVGAMSVDPERGKARHRARPVACADAGAQPEEAEAGRDCTRQPDGAHPLGAGNQEGNLPGSRSRLSAARRAVPGSGPGQAPDAGRPRQGVRANGR